MSDAHDLQPVPDLHPEIGRLLAMLDDNTVEWRRELAEIDVPQDAIGWRPFPKGYNIGAVMFHIAEAEIFWLHDIAAGQPMGEDWQRTFMVEAIDQYEFDWPTPPDEPLDWFYEQLDGVRAKTRELIGAINDPEHVCQRGDRSFTLRWVLHHVIQHEAHHGGQITLLGMAHKHRRNAEGSS